MEQSQHDQTVMEHTILVIETFYYKYLMINFCEIIFDLVTKYIRIGIGDKNDNPPYFDLPVYEAEVNEDEDIQHTVITVTAKDKDECKFC